MKTIRRQIIQAECHKLVSKNETRRRGKKQQEKKTIRSQLALHTALISSLTKGHMRNKNFRPEIKESLDEVGIRYSIASAVPDSLRVAQNSDVREGAPESDDITKHERSLSDNTNSAVYFSRLKNTKHSRRSRPERKPKSSRVSPPLPSIQSWEYMDDGAFVV